MQVFVVKRRIVLVVMAVLLGLLPAAVLAHGGGTPILTRVESGPFLLYVFSQSPQPQAGAPYHVSVAVTQPGRGSEEIGIEDAEVTLHFTPESGEMVMVNAERSAQGPGYYEADVVLPSGGAWNAMVMVNSPLGEGSATWDVQVAQAGGVSWGWVFSGIALIFAGLGVLGYAFTRRSATIPQEGIEGEPETTVPAGEVK